MRCRKCCYGYGYFFSHSGRLSWCSLSPLPQCTLHRCGCIRVASSPSSSSSLLLLHCTTLPRMPLCGRGGAWDAAAAAAACFLCRSLKQTGSCSSFCTFNSVCLLQVTENYKPVGSSINGSGFRPFDMVIPFSFRKGEITGEELIFCVGEKFQMFPAKK